MCRYEARLVQLITCALLLFMLTPVTGHAQDFISMERVEDWFFSRLGWGLIIGAITGVFVGALHLSRLQYQAGSLEVNGQARRKMLVWAGAVAVSSLALLFIDIWLLFPFGDVSLTIAEALTVWLGYRIWIVVFLTLISFFLAGAFSTRMTPGSRCPYAFIPGPRA